MLPTPQDKVLAIWREPFKLGTPTIEHWEHGLTIAQIVARMKCLPAEFAVEGAVTVNGTVIPRDLWTVVRPKATSINKPVAVTFQMPVHGGKKGGIKSIFSIIAALAITVLSGFAAAGGLQPLLGSAFGAGTLGAKALAAGISLVGSLVVGALSSTPARSVAESDSSGGSSLDAASVNGNVLEQNVAIPRVIGTRRIFPPFLSEPITEIIGQDEYVYAIYGLAGPHKIEDIRLGQASVSTADLDTDVDIDVFDGRSDTSPIDIPARYGRSFNVSTEMSVHGTDATDLSVFAPPTPVWHGMSTADTPDETWIHFLLAGLVRQADTTQSIRIPFRVRMRRRGDSAWRYLPEIHYMDNTQSQRRFQFKFRFHEDFVGVPPIPPANRGFVEARKMVPGQNVLPNGTQWDSDPYFSAGAGNDIYRSDTYASTNVQRIALEPDTVTVYLSEADWPDGIYDIEVIRGAAFQNSNFTSNTYVYSGDILDFYGTRSSGQLPMTREGLLDRVSISRIVSVRRQAPVDQKNLALIYLTARNRSVNNLSVKASGYVNDLNQYDLPVAAPTTFAPLSFTALAAVDRTANIAFEADVIFPAIPPSGAVLWEAGWNAPSGSSIFTWSAGTQMQFRAGDGTGAVGASNANTCVLNIPTASLPFDGDRHKVAWDIRINPGRIRIWIDNVLMGEASTTGGGSITAWAAFDPNMGYMTANGGTVAGVTTGSRTDWPDAASNTDLRAYIGQLFSNDMAIWGALVTTSNPAPHYRDILSGVLNLDPLPDALHDDQSLIDWRNVCESEDLTCDLIAEGVGIAELLRIVASCGFARPYQSEVWGVIRDYDRSAESPVQVFSYRNMNSFKWMKAFPRLPAGLRVNYKDDEFEYSGKQIVVYRAGAPESDGRTEQITYTGLVDRSKIITRAKFDLLQGQYRSALYSWSAPAEAIVCRRGSLVGVNHDTLQRQYGAARIVSITLDGSDDLIAIELDDTVTVKNSVDMHGVTDMHAVADMHEVGLNTGIAIRRTNGATTIHRVDNAAGDTDVLTFDPPIDNPDGIASMYDTGTPRQIDEGCLVVIGVVGNEYRRMIVSDIQAGRNLTSSITAVDEAPEIWSALNG